MPEVQLENFGIGGIVRDTEDYTLEPEYWSNGKNVRFLNGEVVKVLGEAETYPTWETEGVTPRATGTPSAVQVRGLIDGVAGNFVVDGVADGDIVWNVTTGVRTMVSVGGSGLPTVLTIDEHIFLNTTDTYAIYDPAALNTIPLWLMPWRDASATGYWLAFTKANILRYTSSTVLDVTRSSADYTGDADTIWSGGVVGGIPVVNYDTGTDYPQSWDASGGDFVDLPNWPSTDSCEILRVFKQFVVAYDVTQSGTRHPHMVKWSSPAYPGSVPDFWDNANSNDSNETNLSEGGGFIIDAEPLGDINMIYKEEKTYGMQHIGGEFVFRFFPLPFGSGMLAPRCAKTITKSRHFVVTKDDVIVHNGQVAESVIDKKNRNYLFNNLSDTKHRKTFVVPNYSYDEVWICFVTSGVDGDYADEVLIWNYKDNTWGHKSLFDVPHIAYGLLDKSGVSQLIDDQGQFIDDDTSLIDGSLFNSGKLRLLGSQVGTTNSKLLEFDAPISGGNENGPMDSYVERTGITIVGKGRDGQPKVSNFTTKLVQRIYPKVDSTSSVNIWVGYQTRLGGSVTYSGPHAFDPVVDNHIDIRLQGKAVCLKIGSSTDIEWSASGATFEMEVLGGSVR